MLSNKTITQIQSNRYMKLCKIFYKKIYKNAAIPSSNANVKMSLLLIVAVFALIGKKVQAVEIIWDNSVDFDSISDEEFSRSGQVRMPNWFLIFPGTKWCGAGNIAEDDNDYGEFRDTDKCCRNHDMCPDIIGGHQTKYNLTNPSFYTRLNCQCDDEFHKCLKSVNSRVSTQVGHLYFTVLGTQCYEKAYPIVGCKKYSYIPTKKCKQYDFDESKEKVYEWFDVPNY